MHATARQPWSPRGLNSLIQFLLAPTVLKVVMCNEIGNMNIKVAMLSKCAGVKLSGSNTAIRLSYAIVAIEQRPPQRAALGDHKTSKVLESTIANLMADVFWPRDILTSDLLRRC
jgi:hypothetical protein